MTTNNKPLEHITINPTRSFEHDELGKLSEWLLAKWCDHRSILVYYNSLYPVALMKAMKKLLKDESLVEYDENKKKIVAEGKWNDGEGVWESGCMEEDNDKDSVTFGMNIKIRNSIRFICAGYSGASARGISARLVVLVEVLQSIFEKDPLIVLAPFEQGIPIVSVRLRPPTPHEQRIMFTVQRLEQELL